MHGRLVIPFAAAPDRTTVYRRIREGTFPKQVKIGPNSVVWRQSDITQWMTSFPPTTANQYIEQYTETPDSAQALTSSALQVHLWKSSKSLLSSQPTACPTSPPDTSAGACMAIHSRSPCT
ncbi:helix-turn-helix transcriptional regulator [Pseudomonas sp. X10]